MQDGHKDLLVKKHVTHVKVVYPLEWLAHPVSDSIQVFQDNKEYIMGVFLLGQVLPE